MIVEHTFVTTESADAAAQRTRAMLEKFGFVHRQDGTAWVDVWRPATTRAAAANEFEYRVRGAFDRQRVSVAITVGKIRARSFAISSSTDAGKPPPEATELMKCIATSIERRLADGCSEEEATAEIRAVEAALAKQAAKRRWWRQFAFWCALAFIVLITGLVVWAASR